MRRLPILTITLVTASALTACAAGPKALNCQQAVEQTKVVTQKMIYRHENLSVDEFLRQPQDQDLVDDLLQIYTDLGLIECQEEYDVLMIDQIDEVLHTTPTGAWLKAEIVSGRASKLLGDQFGTVHSYLELPEESVQFVYAPATGIDSCEAAWSERLRLVAEAGAAADRTTDKPGVRGNVGEIMFTFNRTEGELASIATDLGCSTDDAMEFLIENEGTIPAGGFWTRAFKYNLFDKWR